jgi:protein involved in temperature-dependent protein secretion
MIAYLEKSVTQNPSDIQARLSLADGYVIVGSITKAVATLQSVKTLIADPSAATQLDAWIKAIKAGQNPFETPAPTAAPATTK